MRIFNVTLVDLSWYIILSCGKRLLTADGYSNLLLANVYEFSLVFIFILSSTFQRLTCKSLLILSGNKLSPELIQALSKLAPTTDEELKLRLYCGEISQLGPAERFLKSLVEIPFAFKRMEALLLMSCLQEDVFSIKESFETLEVNL